jgi:hypothetical protein
VRTGERCCQKTILSQDKHLSGDMVISSPISGAGFSILTLQNYARQMNARKVASEQSGIRSTFSPQVSIENNAANKWTVLRADMDGAIEHLKTEVSRVQDIRDKVSRLLTIENAAASATSDDLAQYVLLFDAGVGDINHLANLTTQDPNLLGTTYDGDVSYKKNPELDFTRITHRDLSTGYTLTETGGNYWTKNDEFFNVTLTQYNSSGVATGITAVINQDIRLDSISGSSVDFTIFADTDSEQSFTGTTLTTAGLGVLDSWAYDGLATSDGRALAESTLRTALSTLDGNLANLNGAIAQAQFDFSLAEVQVSGAGRNISDINHRQMLALQESSGQYANTDLALSAAIGRNNILRGGYLILLGVQSTGNIIDISG